MVKWRHRANDLFNWPQLFNRLITLSTGLISIRWKTQMVSLILIRWIVIYPVDSVIQLLNNWGLDSFIFQSLITHQKFLRPSVLRKVQKFSIIGTTGLRGRRSKSPILAFEFSSGTRVSSPANVNIAFLLIFNCKSAVVYCFATMMRWKISATRILNEKSLPPI